MTKDNAEFFNSISPESLTFKGFNSSDGRVEINNRPWLLHATEDDMRLIVNDVLSSVKNNIKDVNDSGKALSSDADLDGQRAQYQWQILYTVEQNNITARTLFIDDIGG